MNHAEHLVKKTIMNNTRKFAAVEDFLNVADPNRLWMPICGYNGYEVSTDNIIRSMKHYKQYPYGILITPKKDKNGNILHPEDPIFELSDDNNNRKTISLSQILDIVKNIKEKIPGYPRYTWQQDISPRNDRHFVKKEQKYAPLNNEIRYSAFGNHKIIER